MTTPEVNLEGHEPLRDVVERHHLRRISDLLAQLALSLAELPGDPGPMSKALSAQLPELVAQRRAERAPGSGVNVARHARWSLRRARTDFEMFTDAEEVPELGHYCTSPHTDRVELLEAVGKLRAELDAWGVLS